MQISKKYFFMSVRNVTNIWLRSTLSEGCDKKVLFPSKAYQLFSFVLSWFVVAQGMSERENGFSWTGLASEWKINTKVSWCAAFKASKNLIKSRERRLVVTGWWRERLRGKHLMSVYIRHMYIYKEKGCM